MKKAIVCIIFLAAILYCIGNHVYHSVSVQFEIEGAVKMKIFSGATGESLETEDTEVIAHITENISSLEFTRGKKEKTDGYTYSIFWYGADGKELEALHLTGANSLIKKDRHYESAGSVNSEIDLAYIQALFERSK